MELKVGLLVDIPLMEISCFSSVKREYTISTNMLKVLVPVLVFRFTGGVGLVCCVSLVSLH